jgi:hypothetical protein
MDYQLKKLLKDGPGTPGELAKSIAGYYTSIRKRNPNTSNIEICNLLVDTVQSVMINAPLPVSDIFAQKVKNNCDGNLACLIFFFNYHCYKKVINDFVINFDLIFDIIIEIINENVQGKEVIYDLYKTKTSIKNFIKSDLGYNPF